LCRKRHDAAPLHIDDRTTLRDQRVYALAQNDGKCLIELLRAVHRRKHRGNIDFSSDPAVRLPDLAARDAGYARDGRSQLLEQLNSLSYEFSTGRDHHSGEIAAGPGEAWHNSFGNGISIE